MKQQTLTAILAIFLITAGAAIAAPLAEVSTDASGVYFMPAASGNYQLTVSGPEGFSYSRTFNGSAPAFSVSGKAAQALADGTYVYELVAIPSKPAEGDRYKLSQKRAQSGAFTIAAGSVVNPNLPESFTKDQVFLDDLIVDGSACIGTDCANGESFGFDTLRLKENNLRIKFDDTSGSASFPNNDWQLTANDSANGGANKFSIDDITNGKTPFTVGANAPSNALYVEASTGDVGMGTATPAVELHVVDGDSPTLRLEQDGSSGFTPQTWDVAGNETNFFVRDVTNGSKLPFKIKPGAPDDSLFIAASGNVGFGTTSVSDSDDLAESFIDVKASSGDARIVADAGSGGFAELLFQENNTNHWSFGHAGNADDRFYIYNYAANREDLTIDATTGQVSILNGLSVTGTCTGCDAVFQPDWDLESIAEHAASMWRNSYLPGVGPTQEGKVTIDMFKKTAGILQELEKAHIYIEQLHQRLERLEARQTGEQAQP